MDMKIITDGVNEQVKETADIALNQLFATTDKLVLGSWGIENISCGLLEIEKKGGKEIYPALTFSVNGLAFQGKLIIALDEGADYYMICGISREGKAIRFADGVCFDELGEVIDMNIERGNCSEEEYLQKIKKQIFSDNMKKNKVFDLLIQSGYTEEYLQELTNMQAMELWLQENGIVGYAFDIAEMVEELFEVKLSSEEEDVISCPVKVGQKVYWNDPDGGLSSGFYTVEDVPKYWEEDAPICISNGYSTAEVPLSELWVQV